MGAYSPPLKGRNPIDYTLLDFNERTIPVAEPIKQAMIAFINSDRLQTYPAYGDITAQLASYCDVNESQVMITNGSDHGIELTIRGVCCEGSEAIIPGPSFPMYHQVAGVEGMVIHEPLYTRESGYPVQQVKALINDNTKLIVVSNPNNPSGTLTTREVIIELANAAPQAAILVDECYFEYTQVSMSDCVEEYPNIVITRTFSKTWGLPSVRFGYVIAAEKNIQALLNVRGPYDINQLAVVAAEAALRHPEYTEQYVAEVMNVSKPMMESFLEEHQIQFWPTAANFVWIFPDRAQMLNDALRAEGILVRPKADTDGKIGLRITLGTQIQTQRLIAVMKHFFEG
ncbi:histidinol-phosphate aminotransferase 2 [Marinibactrum halimedae]|uniref:Histidinol-phosphate aminotransferase 2 n=2 Tax=Marinibactrum halimedae TaxID=1444977 RepID=A0AA37T0V1_9GAMM|nr:histidinol-phosphate aminotransferase 2 [Marinibactrum halimedae]